MSTLKELAEYRYKGRPYEKPKQEKPKTELEKLVDYRYRNRGKV